MKVLLEASHPAHVHFFAPIGQELLQRGHEVVLALRDKDVALALAQSSGIRTLQPPPGRWSGHRPGRGLFGRGPELASRVRWLRSQISADRCDVVVTRNPSGVLAARIAGIPSVFDTDDGRAAGIHFHLAGPFASVITSPELLPERLGRRHVTYPGLKATVFLHPARFSPDHEVVQRYGVVRGDRLFVMRFSANDASHDSGVRTIPDELVETICSRLRALGHVVLSREGHGTTLLRRSEGAENAGASAGAPLAASSSIDVAPEHFLHLLAQAELFVGDSGSVAMEAVALGVPALRIADIHRPILTEIERRLGTLENFGWSESARLMQRLEDRIAAAQDIPAGRMRDRRASVPFEDVVGWFADLVERSVHLEHRAPPHAVQDVDRVQSRQSERDAGSTWSIIGLFAGMRGPLEVVEAMQEELADRGVLATVRPHPRTVRGSLLLVRDVLRSRSGVTFVRFNWALGVPIGVAACWQRFRGRRVILHVPTPIRATMRQVSQETGRTVLIAKWLLGAPSYRAATAACSLIIQNGQDDWRDSVSVARKTILLPNPSTVRAVVQAGVPGRDQGDRSGRILIVGIATTDQYHRYDRFLSGLDGIDAREVAGGPIRVALVGPPAAFVHEQRLMDDLSLRDVEVVFAGERSGLELDALVTGAWIGLGTLGSGASLGLTSASNLKHRLYMRHGVPFLTDIAELAAPADEVSWIHRVTQGSAPIDVAQVLAWRAGLDMDRARREMSAALEATHVSRYVDRILERLEPRESERT